MPLKLNLGLSRKVGEPNYGSRGASVNLEVEVDSTLIGEPAKFQERIHQLFGLVRTSLTEELNGNGKSNGHTANGNDTGASENGHSAPSNGHCEMATPDKPRMATAAQVKAISAIANRQKLNLMLFLQNRIGVARPGDLTIKQASAVIDELKAGVPVGG